MMFVVLLCSMFFFFLMIRRPPRSTLDRSSAASDVYKRQQVLRAIQRDIRNKYHTDYRIAATDSATEALELIKELKPVSYTHLTLPTSDLV